MTLAPLALSFRDQERLRRAAHGIAPVPVRAVSASETLRTGDGVVLVDATAGAVTLTLPAANTMLGRVVTVKKLDAVNNVVLDGAGAETIDGAATQTLTTQYGSLRVVSDGTAWHVC